MSKFAYFYICFGVYHSISTTYFRGYEKYLGLCYIPIIIPTHYLIRFLKKTNIHYLPYLEERSYIKSIYYLNNKDFSSHLIEKYGAKNKEVIRFNKLTADSF